MPLKPPLPAAPDGRFVNDHDPLPLLEQLRNRYGGKIAVRYVQREPGNIVIAFVKE
ncbi:MAG: DUF2249 domain-containing protein [Betaproteobacteria bacterium]|nr:DUF2249 domain-containing protein [Betaproteobacteria bacterium]